MTTAVLTPFLKGAAKPVPGGNGQRLWRKKLLPVGDIDYKGRRISFTRAYNDELAAAYTSGAYDQVPFQLADSSNAHTNDPERYRGDVISVDSEPDGLWITLAPTSRGEQTLLENPRLGISARIVEDYARADGQYYPKAVQHVLGTLDPRIPGLGAWEAIEASSDVQQTIDLTAGRYAGEETGAMPELTEQQRQARLAKLLEIPEDKIDQLLSGLTAPDLSQADLDKLSGQGGTAPLGITDEELDELAAAAAELDAQGLLEDEGELAGTGAALSAEQQMMIDLANAGVDQNTSHLMAIQRKLDDESFANEVRRYADAGLPPYITELAKPLLHGEGHGIELSNGTAVDAGAIMRKVLDAVTRTTAMLDLSMELGSEMDEPAGAQEDEVSTRRLDRIAAFKAQTGIR